jgi:hypothetical protein
MTSVQVSDARMPSLFSFFPPDARIVELDDERGDPAVALGASVTAIRTATPPTDAFVMKFFEPFRTQPSPSRTPVDLVRPSRSPPRPRSGPTPASHWPDVSRGM